MEDALKCKVCKIKYNSDTRQPLLIKCGHTFCKSCITIKSEDSFCPLCGISTSFKIENCFVNQIVEEIVIVYEKEYGTNSSFNNERNTSTNHLSKSEKKLSKNFSKGRVNVPFGNSREKSPNGRSLTYTENENKAAALCKRNSYNNIITIKLSDNRSNSIQKTTLKEEDFDDSSNIRKITNHSPNNKKNMYDVAKEEIIEKEEENSLDTIPLNDDKSVFDHSFRDDFKELLGSNSNSNTNSLINNLKVIKPTNSNDELNSIDNYFVNTPEETSKRLRDEIYKNYTDTNKRKKYEEFVNKALKCPIFANNKKLISYQIINEDFYIGYLEKIKCSKGVIYYSNQDYYEGEFIKDKKEGYGILIYKNGTKYEGMFKNNKQHGNGKLIQPDGETYIGEWKEGRINGHGVRYHSNGDKYTGYYINNIRSGIGTYVFANGDYFEGPWANGKATGKGKFVYSNGNFYEGEFFENQISGKGIFTTSNADVYKGIFKNGLINGQGVLKTHKGETYQGEFLNGKKHGYGNLYSQDGTLLYSGYWNQDNYTGKK